MAKTPAERSADDYIAEKRQRIATQFAKEDVARRAQVSPTYGRITERNLSGLSGHYKAKDLSDDAVMAHRLPTKDVNLPVEKKRSVAKPRSMSKR